MRYINRPETPAILVKKGKEWTEKFMESQKARPDNSKYGHSEILEILQNMSFEKCFYCEASLKEEKPEIDHFIEVSEGSEGKEGAFDWKNLYLTCENCNNKKTHSQISVHEVLNPCLHQDEEIQKHITFDDEYIRPKNNSEIGRLTIQKYKLNTSLLDKKRANHLKNFHKILINILLKRGKREHLSENETEILRSFAERTHAFSLMFEIHIQNNYASTILAQK